MSSSATSGAEKHTIALAKRLADEGHEVELAAPPIDWIAEDLKGYDIPVHLIDMRRAAGINALIELNGLVRKRKFDLIHAHLSRAAYLSLAASAVNNTALVCSVHVKTNYLVYKAAARRKNRVIAVSHYIARLLRESGVPESSIDVVHNGTDFHGIPAQGNGDVHEEFAIPRERRLIGLVGRVAMEKGHHIAVDAFPRVLEQAPDAHMLFVGRDQGDFPDQLKETVRRRDLGGRITFTGNRPDVARLLDSMEFSILPSSAEACPLAVIESMARERPVVGANIGGVDELVIHQKTGLLVDQTPEAFSHGMSYLLQNESERRAMGSNALKMIQERFTFDQMMERMEAVYDRALHRS